ncbi:MAG: DeoR/GlpR family DNA-binding transcription regulator [Actinobacteria bacterium]|nr:DeoR/GlpR family DNA-binding transcription regulator [Actinomycetota bacterium]
MSASSPESNASRRLPAGRKAELAAYVVEAGEVTVARLAEHFEVSPDTIRRDLDQLDADGVLIRTHGGAVSPVALPRPEFGLDVRLRLHADAKETIGRLAATLVQDGDALMLNAGTTTLAVARNLRERHDLTIATNSLRLPAEVVPSMIRDLYIFGGSVRLTAQGTVGPLQIPIAATGGDLGIRCDLTLVGVGAVDPASGYSTSNLAEAVMMGEMMARGTRVAVLADSSKFGRRLFAQIAELDRADYLVTDSPPPAALATALERAGVQVLHPGSVQVPPSVEGDDKG